MRQLCLLFGLIIGVSSLGCAVPVGYGPCGGLACDSCGDCDGGGYAAGPVLPYGPLDALRQARRNLVCGGGGCGDVYYGEWRSYPPNVADPCCGDEFGGGAAPCLGPCLPGLAPGLLLPRNLVPALYGKRMYQNYDECGCGNCSDCLGGDCLSGDCGGWGTMSHAGAGSAAQTGGCNCGGNHVSGHQLPAGRPVASPLRSSPSMARTAAPTPSRSATGGMTRTTQQRTRAR